MQPTGALALARVLVPVSFGLTGSKSQFRAPYAGAQRHSWPHDLKQRVVEVQFLTKFRPGSGTGGPSMIMGQIVGWPSGSRRLL